MAIVMIYIYVYVYNFLTRNIFIRIARGRSGGYFRIASLTNVPILMGYHRYMVIMYYNKLIISTYISSYIYIDIPVCKPLSLLIHISIAIPDSI